MTEAIGLRAILETKAFQKGMKIYLNGLAVLDDKTNKTARGINTGLGNANKGFLSANKGALALGAGLLGLAGGVLVVKELAEGILKVGAASIGSAIDMEQQLANISSLMGGTAAETEMLKGLISDLGLDPNLKVSATEAADSIEMLVKNGVTLDQIMDGAARSSIALSNATGSDFSTASDIATDAMSLFNIEAKDMNTAVDGVTSVLVNSKAGVNDYRLALGQGGSAAKIAGVSFEDFNTVIASSIDAFAGGSEAGTGFRTFVQRLVPDTEVAADKMKKLGLFTGLTEKEFDKISGKIEKANSKLVSLDPTSKNYAKTSAKLKQEIEELNDQLQVGGNAFFDSQGNMKSMAEVSRLLSDATKDLSNEQKISAFRTIFGQDAMATASELAAAGAVTMVTLADGTEVASTAFEELQKKMGEVNAANIIEERMGTLKGALEVIGGVFETVGQKIGDTFLPGLKVLAKSFLNLTDKVMPLLEPVFIVMENSISGFSDKLSSVLAPAIERAIGLIGGLLGVDTGVEFGVSGLDKLQDIDILSGLEDTQDTTGLFSGIKEQFSGISDIASDAMETIKGVFSSVTGFISETVVPGFMRLFDTIAGGDEPVLTVSGIWEGVLKPALQSIGWYVENVLTPAFNIFIDIFGSILPPIIQSVSSLWTGLLVPAISKFGEIFQFVFGVWQDAMPVFKQLAEDAFGRLKTVIDFVSENVMPFFLKQLDKLFVFWDDNGPTIISIIQKLGVFAHETFTVFMEVVKLAWTVISPIIGGVIDVILLLAGEALKILDGQWSDAWGVGVEIVKIAMTSIWDAAWGGATALLELFGVDLVPLIDSWKFIWESVSFIFDKLLTDWEDNWELMGQISDGTWEIIDEGVVAWQGVWDNIKTIFSDAIQDWRDNWEMVKTIAIGVWEIVTGSVDTAIQTIKGFFSSTFEDALVTWQDNWTMVKTIVDTVWIEIKEFVSGGIKELFKLLSGDVTIQNAMGGIMTKVSNAVSESWEAIMILVSEKIQEWVGLIFDTDWFAIGGDIIDLVAEGIDGAIASVQTAVAGIIGKISDTFGSADAFLSIGTNIIRGIIQGMQDSGALLTSAASGLATSILDAINSALGIASPSREGIAIGENFTGSIEMGITSGAASLNRAATNLFDVGAISSAASRVASAISGSFSSVLGSIDVVSDFAESLFDLKETSKGIFTAKNLFGSDRDFSFGDGGTTGTVNLLNSLEKQRNFLKTQEQLLGQIVKLGLDYEQVTQGIVVGPAAGLLDTLKLQQKISEQLRNGDRERLEGQVKFAKNQRSLSLEQQQSLKKARSLAEKFFNVSQDNANKVSALTGGKLVDITSDAVLGRVKELDTINKENDATMRQIKLLAQVKELGLDFEEATSGINILSPSILDSLNLQRRVNQELLNQNKERLRLTQETAAAEEEIARKEAIIAGKEAEIKKIKQLQKIMSDIQAQATQGFDPADILNGITLGLDTSQDDLLDIMVNLSRNALQAMQDEFEIASPSKKTTRFGEQLGEGLKVGVLGKERDVVKAMTSVSDSMVSAPVAPSSDIQMQSNSVLTKLLTRVLGRQSVTNNVSMPVTNHINNGMQEAQATAMFGNQLASAVGIPQ